MFAYSVWRMKGLYLTIAVIGLGWNWVLLSQAPKSQSRLSSHLLHMTGTSNPAVWNGICDLFLSCTLIPSSTKAPCRKPGVIQSSPSLLRSGLESCPLYLPHVSWIGPLLFFPTMTCLIQIFIASHWDHCWSLLVGLGMVSMSVPSALYVEVLTPHVMVTGSGPLGVD